LAVKTGHTNPLKGDETMAFVFMLLLIPLVGLSLVVIVGIVLLWQKGKLAESLPWGLIFRQYWLESWGLTLW
jgi:hypothetical protein